MSDNAIPDRIRNIRFFRRRIVIAALVLLGVVGILAGQLFHLQLRDYPYYTRRLRDNRERGLSVAAPRGLIFDRHGAVLADNQPVYDVDIQPDKTSNIQRVTHKLAQWVNLSPAKLQNLKTSLAKRPSSDSVVVRRDLSKEAVAHIAANQYELPGVKLNAGLRRHYPDGSVTASVVGHMGDVTAQYLRRHGKRDSPYPKHVGVAGIEAQYETLLQGKPGRRTVEVNAQGRVLGTLKEDAGHAGDNLYLTLDAHLQRVAMHALGQAQGAVVALDPENGAVLVLASTPSYDPNTFDHANGHAAPKTIVDNPTHPLINRAISGVYPPGSTIKPVMALAGLNTKHAKYIHRRYDGGYYTLPDSHHRWWGWDRDGLGWVDLHRALVESSDIYFYDLAHDLGIKRIHHFLTLFGFGRSTGIDLPGEAAGVAPSPHWKMAHIGHIWYPGDTVNVGIGQGYLLVTPIQLAQMVSRIAMHGRGWRPHLLRAIQDPVTGTVHYVAPHELKPIVSQQSDDWSRIISAMQDVIDSPHGTAHGISQGLPFAVAGKTGTSQLTKSRNDKHPDALFVCFAPIQHPQIALSVVIRHGGEGGDAAASVARKVLLAFYREGSAPGGERRLKGQSSAAISNTQPPVG